ncbi:MAG: hypothetical protein JRI80_00280 [Deltaproteobacteria bacterium]|nr:hypothetical protein [Deltaproteobacteria bacterium]
MSKRYSVYVRDTENSPWELGNWNSVKHLWNSDIWVQMENSFHGYIKAVMLRDLDPENIPDDVRCIVCEQVTDEFCQGDLLTTSDDCDCSIGVQMLEWSNDLHSWTVGLWSSGYGSDYGDDLYGLEQRFGIGSISRVGHALTHHIVAGKAVAR